MNVFSYIIRKILYGGIVFVWYVGSVLSFLKSIVIMLQLYPPKLNFLKNS